METDPFVELFMKYGVPLMHIGLFMLVVLFVYISMTPRFKIMESLGYVYHKGIYRGTYDQQSHWVKGSIRINYREIDRVPRRRLLKYVERTYS